MTLNFAEIGADKDAPTFFQKKAEPAPDTPEQDYKPVKPYDPLDIEAAKKSLSVYEQKIDEMKKQVERMNVDSERSAAICTEFIAQAATLQKLIDTNRKSIVEDPYKFYKKITAFGNLYVNKLGDIVTIGKKKIGAYQYEKEMHRREVEANAQRERDRLQKEMDARAKKAGVESVVVPDMIVPETTGPVRTEAGTASVSMVWTFEVEDADKVPREYLTVNVGAVTAAVKSGIRSIPGIKIFEKPQVRVRTS